MVVELCVLPLSHRRTFGIAVVADWPLKVLRAAASVTVSLIAFRPQYTPLFVRPFALLP